MSYVILCSGPVFVNGDAYAGNAKIHSVWFKSGHMSAFLVQRRFLVAARNCFLVIHNNTIL